MGSKFAALYAGYVPKRTPINTHNPTPTITESIGIVATAFRKDPARLPTKTPKTIPINPPNNDKTIDSIKN